MRSACTLLLVGCYSATPALDVPCGPGGECPIGQQCDSTGVCRGDDYVEPMVDAQVIAVDAAPPVMFTASNELTDALLADVTGAIPGNGTIVLVTDSGQILRDGQQFRAAGTGVIDGIRFEQTATLGIFVATSLNVQMGQTMSARGDRALVVFTSGDAQVKGTLSVSAGTCGGGGTNMRCGGPGGGDGAASGAGPGTGCGPGRGGASAGDTGGGGGAFGQNGAAGGNETDDALNPGGAGGTNTACTGATLEPLIGGSGGGTSGGNGGVGGGGGGAVQITSRVRVEVSGTIIASGAGGGASTTAGGGGGGAGGAILLEAPVVDVASAVLATNGGGGGEGNATATGQLGQASTSPAQGGDTVGRAGGDGGCLIAAPTPGANGVNNTGGGGGGAGRIRINALSRITTGATISPAASEAELKP